MTELDREDIDDAWSDVGYEPHEHGPHAQPASDVACPLCGAAEGHSRIQSPPGILCGGCMSVFTSAPGEYDAMEARRDTFREGRGLPPLEGRRERRTSR